MLTRRSVLGIGGSLLAGAVPPGSGGSAPNPVIEIHMKSDPMGSVVGFDPVGVLLQPGQTVRWICDANVHTTTAYSPKNENHSLRIPKDAKPWTSDYLLPGQKFEVKLTVEGVYDYFCIPHEQAGMVGRLIVGKPVGPGMLSFDYFNALEKHWLPVPPAAQKAFPPIAEILERKAVPSPLNFSA
ncbi:MAG: plastocyanin/azurin family copper-binding protein [Stellaceae bacterium]